MGIYGLSFGNHYLTDYIHGIYVQKLICPPGLVYHPPLVKIMLLLRILPHDILQLLRFPGPSHINGILRIDNGDILQVIGHHNLTGALIEHRGIPAFVYDLIALIPLDTGKGQILQAADILPLEGAVNHLPFPGLFKDAFFDGNGLYPLQHPGGIKGMAPLHLPHIKSRLTGIIQPRVEFPDFLNQRSHAE